MAITAGGPYATPYVGMGFGVSARRTPGAQWAQGTDVSPGPLVVTTETGAEVRLDLARVAIQGAVLAPCDEGAMVDAMAKLRDDREAPRWIDLLEVKEREIARRTLRPGDYCVIGVKLNHGDGRSLEMVGSWRKPGEDAWMPFSISTGESVTAVVRLLQPLRVGSDEKNARVHVKLDPARWFDGVDLAGDEKEAAAKVLANLAQRPGEALVPPKEQQAAR